MLLKDLFQGQFVVDEPREEVVDLHKERGDFRWSETGAANDQAMTTTPSPDLLLQISEMLREQTRLERLAVDLQAQGDKSQEQELSRFFRMSLSLLDSFDRIMQMAQERPPSEEVQNWLKSLAVIQSRMTELFEGFGLRTMDPVGKSVDLGRHEVVEIINTDSIPDETVIEVRKTGYMFGGKVLRDASVVVAKNDNG